jgi:hypothetical protein
MENLVQNNSQSAQKPMRHSSTLQQPPPFVAFKGCRSTMLSSAIKAENFICACTKLLIYIVANQDIERRARRVIIGVNLLKDPRISSISKSVNIKKHTNHVCCAISMWCTHSTTFTDFCCNVLAHLFSHLRTGRCFTCICSNWVMYFTHPAEVKINGYTLNAISCPDVFAFL